jgi:histone deacetylase 11
MKTPREMSDDPWMWTWKNKLLGLAMTLLALVTASVGLARKPRNPSPSPGVVLPGPAVVAWSPGYRVSFFGVEHLHPFDSFKYDKIAEALLDRGLVPADGFLVPAPVSQATLEAVHDPAYLEALLDHRRLSEVIEVPVPGIFGQASIEARILDPFRRASGGTIAMAQAALEHGVGINLGGGYHHARPEGGHGFCVYNDVAAALHTLRAEGFEGMVLIVDTDAHQGDGNHAAFDGDPSVYTLSLQQRGIFPQPRVPGDRDVELPSGMDDSAYLARLQGEIERAIEASNPALIVHVAGSDVLWDDPLTEMGLSVEGLVERDLSVFHAARERGIPYLHLLAGGYGPSSAEASGASVAAMLEELRGE